METIETLDDAIYALAHADPVTPFIRSALAWCYQVRDDHQRYPRNPHAGNEKSAVLMARAALNAKGVQS